MTIPTRQDVDGWLASCHRQLDQITAAILDLIDIGAEDRPTAARRPSRREQDATDRADGRFEPTTVGRTRHTGPSDPTLAAVLTWETDVQRAVLALYGVVSATDDIAGALGLTVHDETGDGLVAPREPATGVAGSGRLVVTDHPRLCRIATLNAVWWLAAAMDALGDRLRRVDDPDVGDHLTDRAELIRRLLVRLAHHVDAGGPVRRCAAGCGGAAPETGGVPRSGARCNRCLKRSSRARQAGAA